MTTQPTAFLTEEVPVVLIVKTTSGQLAFTEAATKESLAGWIIRHNEQEHKPTSGLEMVGGGLIALGLAVAIIYPWFRK